MLPRPVKEGFEKLVAAGGGNVKLLEGYGLTEAVSAVMATPLGEYREGTIGVPLPHMLVQTANRKPARKSHRARRAKSSLAGPTVMKSYLDDP